MRGSRRSDLLERLRERLAQAEGGHVERSPSPAARRFNPHKKKACGPGELLVRRRAYTRSDGTHVKGTSYCTPDRGKPGRGRKIFTIQREGDLGGPGYLEKPAAERHKILDRAVKKYGYRSILGKVHALEVLGKNTLSKAKLKKLAQDRGYLRKKYGGPGSFGPRKNNPVVVHDEPSEEQLVASIRRMLRGLL